MCWGCGNIFIRESDILSAEIVMRTGRRRKRVHKKWSDICFFSWSFMYNCVWTKDSSVNKYRTDNQANNRCLKITVMHVRIFLFFTGRQPALSCISITETMRVVLHIYLFSKCNLNNWMIHHCQVEVQAKSVSAVLFPCLIPGKFGGDPGDIEFHGNRSTSAHCTGGLSQSAHGKQGGEALQT